MPNSARVAKPRIQRPIVDRPRADCRPDVTLIADAIPHIVFTAPADGATTYFNKQGTEYTGLPAETNYGWNWLSLVHPIDQWIGTATDIDHHKQWELSLRELEQEATAALTLLESIDAAAPVGFKLVDRVVDVIDVDGLVALAAANDCCITVMPRMGDFVATTAPLARVRWSHGVLRRDIGDEVRRRILLTSSRTHTDDPAYGIRKLADVAVHGLASGPFTDPTTSVQAIDRLHGALRQLVHRRLPPPEHRDAHGTVRVVTRELDWSGFVRLSFDEIRIAGAGSPQVARRQRAALEDLLSIAPPDRREPLQRQLRLLDAGVRREYDEDDDIAAMSRPDAQGIGSGPDVINLRNPEPIDVDARARSSSTEGVP